MIDIITVTYNSEKWLNGYFNGLLSQVDFSLKKINLIIVDNNSSDNTLNLLDDYKAKYAFCFYDIVIVKSEKNWGFGKANNTGSIHSKSDHLFFLNVDVQLLPDNLKTLETEISKKDYRIGAWELRQMPYEHPKFYDPVTLETSWASAAALLVRKDVYTQAGGFDPNFFMYCEDVDLSWKIRLEGKAIKYLPHCKFYHYTYNVINEIKETAYYYGILNNLFIRIKFGNKNELKEWLVLVWAIFKQKGIYEHARKKLLLIILKNLTKLPSLFFWRIKNKQKVLKYSPQKFIGFNYEITRGAGFYYTILPKFSPLISVLVRTCNRPDVLRQTLISLRNQTYRNFEIILVEDGPNRAEKMIIHEFSDLNIKYFSTIRKVGRCVAGNVALSKSTGKFLCFLDDDDYYYPDYLETMVVQFERNPDLFMVNSLSFLYEIETKSTKPYAYEVKKIMLQDSPIFNLLILVKDNFYPIQSIMFRRTVYEELGGFKTDVDHYEDWLLWLTYTSRYPMYSILKVCSIFKVPFEEHIKKSRLASFQKHRSLANSYAQELKLNIDLFSLSELQKLN